MMNKFFSILSIIFSFSAFAQNDWQKKNDPLCEKLKVCQDQECIQLLKKADFLNKTYCTMKDSDSQSVVDTFKAISMLIPQLNLPQDLIKRWYKVSWNEIQMFMTDYPLCLQQDDTCTDADSLVAKNYKVKKEGFILVNRTQWKNISASEKYSLVWHEVLSILGYEKNSYEYSSMVEFNLECRYVHNSSTLRMKKCDVVARSYNK